MTAYRWKPGVVTPLEPQTAGEALERIRVRHNGNLEPAFVVDAARPADSPLHGHFEWNDHAAAERFREDQARYLIRSIEIVRIRTDDDSEAPIRAFVSIERDDERTYTSTVDALADPDLRAQVIARAWRELEAWRQRHAELCEFARVFTAIEQARGAE